MSELKLSPMRLLAITIAATSKEREVTPGGLSRVWLERKGNHPRGSIRDNFGNNSAAYHTLRWLKDNGLLIKVGNWSNEFILTQKG